jgi:hypothetical protein
MHSRTLTNLLHKRANVYFSLEHIFLDVFFSLLHISLALFIYHWCKSWGGTITIYFFLMLLMCNLIDAYLVYKTSLEQSSTL